MRQRRKLAGIELASSTSRSMSLTTTLTSRIPSHPAGLHLKFHHIPPAFKASMFAQAVAPHIPIATPGLLYFHGLGCNISVNTSDLNPCPPPRGDRRKLDMPSLTARLGLRAHARLRLCPVVCNDAPHDFGLGARHVTDVAHGDIRRRDPLQALLGASHLLAATTLHNEHPS